MRSLVLGCGPVGAALAKELVDNGDTVRVLTRSRSKVLANVKMAYADLQSPETQESFDWADVVFHTANAPYHRWPELLPGLWQSVVEKAKAASTRLVAMTNVYSYGRFDSPLTEEHPWNTETRKGTVRKQIETMVLEEVQGGRLDGYLVRASDFYGPYRVESALGDRFFEGLAKKGQLQFPGASTVPHSYTYLDDIARTLSAVGRTAAPRHREYLVPNDRPLTGNELAGLLSRLTGKELKPKAAGRGFFRFAGVFVPGAREMIEMLYEFERPFIIPGNRARDEFGIQPTPIGTGLEKTLSRHLQ